MIGVEAADRYVEDVMEGRIAACRWTRLAVERCVADHERPRGGDWPWVFDPELAREVVEFKANLVGGRGRWAGRRYRQLPWQVWRDCERFGWVDARTGRRRFREAFTEVARKNGKTTDSAALLNYFLSAVGEAAAQVFFAATKQDQAAIGWDEMCRQLWVDRSVPFDEVLGWWGLRRNRQWLRLTRSDDEGRAQALAADADKADGLDVSVACIDEYHAHRSGDLLDKLRTATSARRDGFVDVVTSAGVGVESVCYRRERRVAQQVLLGTLSLPRLWACLWAVDCPREFGDGDVADDDWLADDSVWAKANPSLGVVKSLDYLGEEVAKARAVESRRQLTGALDFGVWGQSGARWVSVDKWRGAQDAERVGAPGVRSALGFDLAQKIDLCAVCRATVYSDGVVGFSWAHLVGEAGYRRLRPAVPGLDGWARAGRLVICGEVVRTADVVSAAQRLAAGFRVVTGGYDPWQGEEVAAALAPVVRLEKVPQVASRMVPPAMWLPDALASGRVAHDGDPVVEWQVGQADVQLDAAQRVRLRRPERKEGAAIDGLVAMLVALAVLDVGRAPAAGGAASGGGRLRSAVRDGWWHG